MNRQDRHNPVQVSASILCADFTRLKDEVEKCEQAGVDSLHIDVMDGHFVPNITIGPVIVESLRKITRLPLECHLMIDHPGDYIEDFINAGANAVMVHAECYGQRRPACREYGQYPKEVDRIDPEAAGADLARIRRAKARAFMVLNPGTPLCVQPVLGQLDGVLMMSVNPGFAKQKFMPEVLPKIRELRAVFKGAIAIDGGINDKTASLAVEAGANVLATASYLFGAVSAHEAVRALKALG